MYDFFMASNFFLLIDLKKRNVSKQTYCLMMYDERHSTFVKVTNFVSSVPIHHSVSLDFVAL